MSDAAEDPRCPECGEPIGQTATYCMHCSADLTEDLQAADSDGDWRWDDQGDTSTESSQAAERSDDQLLNPDGLVDNSLTVVVGILAGIVIGLVGTFVLAAVTGSAWALLFGVVVWLGATAYLVRRRTVQGAIAKGGYGLAIVLLLVPVIAFSPVTDAEGGLGGRGEVFVVMLLFVAIPAAFAAGVGWFASQYVPDEAGGSDG